MTTDNDKVEAYGGVIIDKAQLTDACRELAQFVVAVEKLLEEVEKDNTRTKNFVPVAEKLDTVKGNARQMNLTKIADLAELAEELAVKGAVATKRPVVRKVVGALWDAITTLNHMLGHVATDTASEADILMQRLEAALKSLGGAREKVSQDEIDELIKKS
jgi:chemotaxis protein histidine kinase CheA